MYNVQQQFKQPFLLVHVRQTKNLFSSVLSLLWGSDEAFNEYEKYGKNECARAEFNVPPILLFQSQCPWLLRRDIALTFCENIIFPKFQSLS